MRPRRSVGITISDGLLRAVELHDGEMKRWGEIEIGEVLGDNAEAVDEEALTSALRQLWRSEGFGTKRVAVVIETEAATIRRVRLPQLSADETRSAVAFDLAEVLAYPTSDAVIDYSLIPTTPVDPPPPHAATEEVVANEIEATAVAVRQSLIESIRRAVGKAGLHWARSDLVSSAALALLPPDENPDATAAIVSIGERSTTVTVHDGQGLLFARALMTGIGAGSSLSQDLEAQLTELESLRSGRSADVTHAPAVVEAPGVSIVAEGIRRTLDYYAADIDRRPVGSIVLCGARCESEGLVERLVSTLPHIDVSTVERPEAAEVDAPERFDLARGAALLVQRTTRSDRAISLLPEGIARARTDRRALLIGSAVAVAISILGMLDSTNRATALTEREQAVEVIEGAIGGVNGQLANLDANVALAADVERRRSLVADLAQGDVSLSTVLGQIGEAMPADTFLLNVSVDRRGESLDQNGLATLTIDAAAPDLDGVGRWIESVEATPTVENLWLQQAVFGPYGSGRGEVALFTVRGIVTADAAATQGWIETE